jgi:hypothetical protein
MICKIASPRYRSCQTSEYFRLAILSLHHILDLAVTELVAIGKEMLKPLEGDKAWMSHSIELDEISAQYNAFLEVLRSKLRNTSGALAQVVLTASMDISYPLRSLNDTETFEGQEDKMSVYEGDGHHGIAYIFQMQRLRHKTDPTNQNVKDMIDIRDRFIDSIDCVLGRQQIEGLTVDGLTFDIDETQLFVPRDLFQIPAIAKAIEQDGRRDCLWRPPSYMLHDNKVSATFRVNSHEDNLDILRRSKIHIAVGFGADKQHSPDLTLLPNFKWTFPHALGLDALHVAAIHGNTHTFHAAAASGVNTVLSTMSFRSSYSKRTCMHWAACFGHLELVEYLINLHRHHHNHLDIIMVLRDQWADTPLHLAARNGHTNVVKALSPDTIWTAMEEHPRHTPFWAATTGRHLDIMKLLQPFCNVDEKEHQDEDKDRVEWLTPLAEASRQGFIEGVQYLLSLESVTVNSINGFRDKSTWKVVLKTPLDLAIEGGHTECIELLQARGALTRLELDLMG